jgi:hypothetical protein
MAAIVERNGYRYRVREKELDKYLKQYPGAKVVQKAKADAAGPAKTEKSSKGKNAETAKPEKEQASS